MLRIFKILAFLLLMKPAQSGNSQTNGADSLLKTKLAATFWSDLFEKLQAVSEQNPFFIDCVVSRLRIFIII